MMHEYSDHDTSDMPSWCSPEGQHVETTLRNMAAHEILLFDNSYSFQWHSLFINADKLCADSSAEVDKRKTRIIRKLHSAGEREIGTLQNWIEDNQNAFYFMHTWESLKHSALQELVK